MQENQNESNSGREWRAIPEGWGLLVEGLQRRLESTQSRRPVYAGGNPRYWLRRALLARPTACRFFLRPLSGWLHQVAIVYGGEGAAAADCIAVLAYNPEEAGCLAHLYAQGLASEIRTEFAAPIGALLASAGAPEELPDE